MKHLATLVYVIMFVGMAGGAVTAGLNGIWTTVAAWIAAIVWAALALIAQRRADQYGTAYVLAVGRNAGEYARGLRHGYTLAGKNPERED